MDEVRVLLWREAGTVERHYGTHLGGLNIAFCHLGAPEYGNAMMTASFDRRC
jgi:hypothetical protein